MMPMSDGQLASLAVVAEKHREQEEALRLAGNVSGLAIGAAALLIEMALEEIRHLRKVRSDMEGEFLNYADEVAALGQLCPAKIDGLKRIAARIRRQRNGE